MKRVIHRCLLLRPICNPFSVFKLEGFAVLVNNPELLPSLKGIIVAEVTPRDLQFLITFPRKLKQFAAESFALPCGQRTIIWPDVYTFLHSQSGSARFHWFCDGCLSADGTWIWVLVFKLPSLLVLVRLEIKLLTAGIKFVFGEEGRAVNYEKDFPKLKYLKFLSAFDNLADPATLELFYDSFAPTWWSSL